MVTMDTKTSPCINDPITARTVAEAYCKDRNKAQGMLAAGYMPSYANSGRGQAIVYSHVRTLNAITDVMAETRANIAEVLKWEREDNLCHQYKQLARYERLLDGDGKEMKANPNNQQALAGIDRVLRELNASSNQHSSTVLDGKEDTKEPMTAQDEAFWRRVAKDWTDRQSQPKVIESEVINV